MAFGANLYHASLPWTFKPWNPGFLHVAHPFKLPLHLKQPNDCAFLMVVLAFACGFLALACGFLPLVATLALAGLATLAAAGFFISCFFNIDAKACWFHWSNVLVALPSLFFGTPWSSVSLASSSCGGGTGTMACDGAATGAACSFSCKGKGWLLEGSPQWLATCCLDSAFHWCKLLAKALGCKCKAAAAGTLGGPVALPPGCSPVVFGGKEPQVVHWAGWPMHGSSVPPSGRWPGMVAIACILAGFGCKAKWQHLLSWCFP